MILVEAAYVLRTYYSLPRQETIDALMEFVRKESIHVHGIDRNVAIEALGLCRPSNRVSVADAMIWAVARCAPPACVYSFDQRFPASVVEVRRP